MARCYCGKVKHRTVDDAMRAFRTHSKADQNGLRPYLCKLSQMWHLGHAK